MKWTLKNVALLLAPATAMALLGVFAWISPVLALVVVAAVMLLATGWVLALTYGDE